MYDEALAILWGQSRKSQITNELAIATPRRVHAVENFNFLLGQIKDIELGDEAITGVLMHENRSKEVLDLLLSSGVQIEITQNILKTAAAFPGDDCQVLRLLLRHGNNVNVTEDVFQAAAFSGS